MAEEATGSWLSPSASRKMRYLQFLKREMENKLGVRRNPESLQTYAIKKIAMRLVKNNPSPKISNAISTISSKVLASDDINKTLKKPIMNEVVKILKLHSSVYDSSVVITIPHPNCKTELTYESDMWDIPQESWLCPDCVGPRFYFLNSSW